MVKPKGERTSPKIPPRPFRIFTPKSMRHELVVQAHGAHKAFGAHQGVDKTRARIDHWYWWSSMTADCKKICSECDICMQTTNKGRPPPPPRTPARVPTRPGHTIQMDLQGPVHSRKYGRNSYILVIIDAFSRYMTLRLIPNKKGDSIAKQLIVYFQTMGRRAGS